jgi:hypothetical protein
MDQVIVVRHKVLQEKKSRRAVALELGMSRRMVKRYVEGAPVALGVEAARQRRHVAFWRAADLVRTLLEAREERAVGRLMRRLERVDLLVLDEVGFVPFDRAGGELLFNVLSARHSRRSVLLTTNLAFGEWPKVFGGDEKLTTALLDRLGERATVITTRGKSYRMRKRAAAAPGRGEEHAQPGPPSGTPAAAKGR